MLNCDEPYGLITIPAASKSAPEIIVRAFELECSSYPARRNSVCGIQTLDAHVLGKENCSERSLIQLKHSKKIIKIHKVSVQLYKMLRLD